MEQNNDTSLGLFWLIVLVIIILVIFHPEQFIRFIENLK